MGISQATDCIVVVFSLYFRTVVQERQFESICTRLLNARTHFSHAVQSLMGLKNEKPKAYLVVMMGVFAVLAWIGSLIDNLLLTYLLGKMMLRYNAYKITKTLIVPKK